MNCFPRFSGAEAVAADRISATSSAVAARRNHADAAPPTRGGSVAIDVGGRRIDVKVPAGIGEGKRLRVPPEATGGTEVLLRVNIAPHQWFRREGNDIYLDVPISVSEAILGGKVEVPTIDGARLEVKVPPGTSSGAKLRLRGKGVADGDQYLVFKVVVNPGPVDDRSRELIEEFAKLNPKNARENVPWK
jgi:curved DNA-binding protein